MRQKEEAISIDSKKKELNALDILEDSLILMLSEHGDMRL
jgi:hypothetical protein